MRKGKRLCRAHKPYTVEYFAKRHARERSVTIKSELSLMSASLADVITACITAVASVASVLGVVVLVPITVFQDTDREHDAK